MLFICVSYVQGLVRTFDELLPRADHRYCVRHMYANFKGQYKERIFKDEMWMAATSYTVHGFEEHMEKIRSLDQGAHNWLRAVPASLWSRSHFSTRTKCEMLCNNPSESWNKYILKARDKPIIIMLEMIRKMVMSRIQTKRQMMLRAEGLLCPKIHDKLEKLIEDSRNCLVTYAGEQMYEVDCFPRTYIVNLQRQTCLCRQWDITGIPCIHFIACIFKFNMRPQNYVDPCYRIETYLRSYANMIYPISDSSQWEATGSNPIAPPLYRIQPRRPLEAIPVIVL